MDLNRQPDSPSEEEPVTPRPAVASQNPKYQLFLGNDLKTNGVGGKDADGPGGGGSLGENGPTRLPHWETNRLAVHRGSSESLASRDLDSAADRVGDVGAADSRHTVVAVAPFLLFLPSVSYLFNARLLQGKAIITQCHLVDVEYMTTSCPVQVFVVLHQCCGAGG